MLTEAIVDAIVITARFLMREGAAGNDLCHQLLRALFEHVVFNFRIWMNASSRLQVNYYNRIGVEFGKSALARAITGVRKFLKALQEFYSSEKCLTRNRSDSSMLSFRRNNQSRSVLASSFADDSISRQESVEAPPQGLDELSNVRLAILGVLKEFIFADGGITATEFEEFLHYIAEASEIGNQQIDFLRLFLQLVSEQTRATMSMLDSLDGIGVLLSQLRSSNEDICVQALRIISVALQHASPNMREDIVRRYELAATISLNLTRHWKYLPVKLYHTLFDLLTHSVAQLSATQQPRPHLKLHQPEILLVFFDFFGVGSNISSDELQSTFALPTRTEESNFTVIDQFLDDLLWLLKVPENIVALDQFCGAWQRGLLLLLLRAMIGRDVVPSNWTQVRWTQQVQMLLFIFRILLLHSIRTSKEGWRGWVELCASIRDVFSSPETTIRTVEFGLTTHRFRLPGHLEVIRLFLHETITSFVSELSLPIDQVSVAKSESVFVSNLRANPAALTNIVSIIFLSTDLVISMAKGEQLFSNVRQELAVFTSQQGYPSSADGRNADSEAENAVKSVSNPTTVEPSADAVRESPDKSPAPIEPSISSSSISGLSPPNPTSSPSSLLLMTGLAPVSLDARFPSVQRVMDDLTLILDEVAFANNFDLREVESVHKLSNGSLARQCARFLIVRLLHILVTQIAAGNEQATVAKRDEARIHACLRRVDAGPKVATFLFASVAACLSREFASRFPSGQVDAAHDDAIAVIAPYVSLLRTIARAPGGQSALVKLFCDRDGRSLLSSQPQWMGAAIPSFAAAMAFVSRDWQNALTTAGFKVIDDMMAESADVCSQQAQDTLRILESLKDKWQQQTRIAQQSLQQNAFLTAHQQDEEIRLVAESSARTKLRVLASVSWAKILDLVTNERGVWGTATESLQKFWKIDTIEDPLRRMRRIVPDTNTYKYQTNDAAESVEADHDSEEKSRGDWMQFIKNSLGFSVDLASASTRPTLATADTADESEQPNDSSLSPLAIASKSKVLVNAACEVVIPGYRVPGQLLISSTAFYFIVDEKHKTYVRAPKSLRDRFDALNGHWTGSDIQAAAYRRYMLAYTAIEMFFKNRTSLFVNLLSASVCKKVMKNLPTSDGGDHLYDLGPYLRHTIRPSQLVRRSSMTQRWQNREISNFEYLMFLNTVASRSYNDLSQYPIFPWIIANYTSPQLDMTDLSNFRDLSKPIGVLSPERLATFLDRYNTWEEGETGIPKFHYGTHYSTPGYVLFWLIRLQPFTDLSVRLQVILVID